MSINDNDIDASLWARFKNGGDDAFAMLFRKYYPGLFNYGCRIVNDSTLVEDCIQELFLDIWRNGRRAEIVSVKAYLFQAFKFKIMKLLAKRNKTSSLVDNEAGNGFELSREALMIDKEEHSATAKQLAAAIDALSPRQKEIIYLKFYLGLSYEEVSSMMQINYQAARNLTYQAIKILKQTIAPGIITLLFFSTDLS